MVRLRFPQAGVRSGPSTDRTIAPMDDAAQRQSARLAIASDALLGEGFVKVARVLDFSSSARDVADPGTRTDVEEIPNEAVLALETQDGAMVYLRADRLQQVARQQREVKEGASRLRSTAQGADDVFDLPELVGESRGVGQWLRRLMVLDVDNDDITEEAAKTVAEHTGKSIKSVLADWARVGATQVATKALMAAIESRLDRAPGLYRWDTNGALSKPTAAELSKDAERGMLIFIHGTGSNTEGSFAALRENSAGDVWSALQKQFGDAIYGFEHRTFSESPISNALQLARILPKGARVHLVTHSRGGIVGDLLTLGADSVALIELIDRKNDELAEADAEDRQALRALITTLQQIQVERYVRVGAPARGTRLLGEHLDVFLSVMLSLLGAAATLTGQLWFKALKRVTLEVARNRLNPRMVPGIEAMLPDSPVQTFLARAPRQANLRMAVIAGDGQQNLSLKGIVQWFADWTFFDKAENDWVVDTASMLGRPLVESSVAASRVLAVHFDQGPEVNHFRYFTNAKTRNALRDWLMASGEQIPASFEWVKPQQSLQESRASRAVAPAAINNRKPVVILLPGTMGSHLGLPRKNSKHTNRVWMDPVSLAAGGLLDLEIARNDIALDGLFGMFYGDLANFLDQSHQVVEFPYDWRRDIRESAARLNQVVGEVLQRSGNQPVRVLAHSMGGLVVRSFAQQFNSRWQELLAREGARFVMLGTPNHGSHLMVETLLGKGTTIRMLARLDQKHDLKTLLKTVGDFYGVLQLLPKPGFVDEFQSGPVNYFDPRFWQASSKKSSDWWFGKELAPALREPALKVARDFWQSLDGAQLGPAEKIAYVFGVDDKTPAGIRETSDSIKMLATTKGDGSVTWKSGISGELEYLRTNQRCWYMPAAHGELAGTEEFFPDILGLLETGKPKSLQQTAPAQRSMSDVAEVYDAGPVADPSEAELLGSIMSRRRRRRQTAKQTRQAMRVRVRAMDLRFVDRPIVCGHYEGDAISGPEAMIDSVILNGALTRRYRLPEKIYAGALGTSTISLIDDANTVAGRGAVVVGLGLMHGSLGLATLTDTVRASALRFLLHIRDRLGEPRNEAAKSLKLSSLLLGSNSTTSIGIEDSVTAVLLGMAQANRQFQDVMESSYHIGDVEFIEIYLDTAHSAVKGLSAVAREQEQEFAHIGCALQVDPELMVGEGATQRLYASESAGYWPKMVISDPSRNEFGADSAHEHYSQKSKSPASNSSERSANEQTEVQAADPWQLKTPIARAMKFTYLGARARAETIVQQRQPGLLEALVKDAIRSTRYHEELSRTLFQLMVPLEFKSAARQADQLVLVLDGYTANLPWEMLRGDDLPMVCGTRVVRQFVSPHFRTNVHMATARNALVIGNPSTDGFNEQFEGPEALPSLTGAEQEADLVANALSQYQVTKLNDRPHFSEVMTTLFARPYRMVHIAAHGEFNLKGKDGEARSGVVLSNGMFLTAAEIGQMDAVPELVFINCCHSAQNAPTPINANRLAYGIARELIEMGVRCVIAAGWAVDDAAALTFAEVFYRSFVAENLTFGEALFLARKAVYNHPDHAKTNTWGAYQAYGDPNFVLDANRSEMARAQQWQPISAEEVVQQLHRLQSEAQVRRGFDRSMQELGNENTRIAKSVGDLVAAAGRWRKNPAVLHAHAETLASLGPEYFEEAIALYLEVIGRDDSRGAVPIRAIEQMCNMQARLAEQGCDQLPSEKAARTAKLGAQIQLVEQSIERMEHLRNAVVAEVNAPLRSAQKAGVLGSALKRRAYVYSFLVDADWPKVERELQHSRAVYVESLTEGDVYSNVNVLFLDGLGIGAETAPLGAEDANKARTAAWKRYEESLEFWDGVAFADLLVAEHLFHRNLLQHQSHAIEAYAQVLRRAPFNRRELTSVARQLVVFARCYAFKAKAAKPKDAELLLKEAAALLAIADSLDEESPAEFADLKVQAATPDADAASVRVVRSGVDIAAQAPTGVSGARTKPKASSASKAGAKLRAPTRTRRKPAKPSTKRK